MGVYEMRNTKDISGRLVTAYIRIKKYEILTLLFDKEEFVSFRYDNRIVGKKAKEQLENCGMPSKAISVAAFEDKLAVAYELLQFTLGKQNCPEDNKAFLD